MENKVVIYTDGSCLGNPGPGGRCALLKFKDKQKIISGAKANTTNNQMELLALIKALQSLKTTKYPVIIYTDSKYVLDGITKWIKNWKKNNWKTTNKKEIKNKDLWQRLDELMNKFDTDIYWVKAHSDSVENNLVDQIARQKAGNIK